MSHTTEASLARKKAHAQLVQQVHDAKSTAELAKFYAAQWSSNADQPYVEIQEALAKIITKLKEL